MTEHPVAGLRTAPDHVQDMGVVIVVLTSRFSSSCTVHVVTSSSRRRNGA